MAEQKPPTLEEMEVTARAAGADFEVLRDSEHSPISNYTVRKGPMRVTFNMRGHGGVNVYVHQHHVRRVTCRSGHRGDALAMALECLADPHGAALVVMDKIGKAVEEADRELARAIGKRSQAEADLADLLNG